MDIRFDRGALVAGEAGPGMVWDARVGAWRAPAHRLGEIERALGRAADVAPDGGEWHAPKLRPYQQEALDAWLAADRRGVVVLPTGACKTKLALAAAAALECRVLERRRQVRRAASRTEAGAARRQKRIPET